MAEDKWGEMQGRNSARKSGGGGAGSENEEKRMSLLEDKGRFTCS